MGFLSKVILWSRSMKARHRYKDFIKICLHAEAGAESHDTFDASFYLHMSSHNKVSVAGILIALGIIYGDIGTSPLYVLNAITNGKTITYPLIIGSLSLNM